MYTHTYKAKSKRAIIYTSFQLHLNIFERNALFKGKLTARTDTGYYTIENIWDPSVSLASSFRNDIWMARRGGRKKEGRRGGGEEFVMFELGVHLYCTTSFFSEDNVYH